MQPTPSPPPTAEPHLAVPTHPSWRVPLRPRPAADRADAPTRASRCLAHPAPPTADPPTDPRYSAPSPSHPAGRRDLSPTCADHPAQCQHRAGRPDQSPTCADRLVPLPTCADHPARHPPSSVDRPARYQRRRADRPDQRQDPAARHAHPQRPVGHPAQRPTSVGRHARPRDGLGLARHHGSPRYAGHLARRRHHALYQDLVGRRDQSPTSVDRLGRHGLRRCCAGQEHPVGRRNDARHHRCDRRSGHRYLRRDVLLSLRYQCRLSSDRRRRGLELARRFGARGAGTRTGLGYGRRGRGALRASDQATAVDLPEMGGKTTKGDHSNEWSPFRRNPAASYSPRQFPAKYHRRRRA